MSLRNDILTLLHREPGLCGGDLYERLEESARTVKCEHWIARWFGIDSSLFMFFCVPSFGAIYVELERLEDEGLVTARQGAPSAARGGRPRLHFYPADPAFLAAQHRG